MSQSTSTTPSTPDVAELDARVDELVGNMATTSSAVANGFNAVAGRTVIAPAPTSSGLDESPEFADFTSAEQLLAEISTDIENNAPGELARPDAAPSDQPPDATSLITPSEAVVDPAPAVDAATDVAISSPSAPPTTAELDAVLAEASAELEAPPPPPPPPAPPSALAPLQTPPEAPSQSDDLTDQSKAAIADASASTPSTPSPLDAADAASQDLLHAASAELAVQEPVAETSTAIDQQVPSPASEAPSEPVATVPDTPPSPPVPPFPLSTAPGQTSAQSSLQSSGPSVDIQQLDERLAAQAERVLDATQSIAPESDHTATFATAAHVAAATTAKIGAEHAAPPKPPESQASAPQGKLAGGPGQTTASPSSGSPTPPAAVARTNSSTELPSSIALEAPKSPGPGLWPKVASVMVLPLRPLAAMHERLSESTRQTIGYCAIMTLFFGMGAWVYIAVHKPNLPTPTTQEQEFYDINTPAHGVTAPPHPAPPASEKNDKKDAHGGDKKSDTHGDSKKDAPKKDAPKKDAHGSDSHKKEAAKKPAAKKDAHASKDKKPAKAEHH